MINRRTWARLSRPTGHRIAMLRTMVTQLLEHERICTTFAKAQALRRYADKVIALGKKGTKPAYERARGIVRTDRELHKLFTTMAMRYRDRNGGFTRVVAAGQRENDAVPLAFIEFVDRPGELKPAARPAQVSPLLPMAAQAYLRQQANPQQQLRKFSSYSAAPLSSSMSAAPGQGQARSFWSWARSFWS